MFLGRDNPRQLIKISEVLGTDDLYEYLDKYEVSLDTKDFGNIKQ